MQVSTIISEHVASTLLSLIETSEDSGRIWDLILFFPFRKILLSKRSKTPFYVARFWGQLLQDLHSSSLYLKCWQNIKTFLVVILIWVLTSAMNDLTNLLLTLDRSLEKESAHG